MKYGAWNSKSKGWVKWLGYTNSKKDMNTRLKVYQAPKHVVSKQLKRK